MMKLLNSSQQNLKVLSLFPALLLLGAAANADATTYQLTPHGPGNTGVKFSIGYTAGTHRGQASQALGNVVATTSPLQIQTASISIPITAMSTDDTKRDCHMREAFGLDYSRSKYPNEHICDSDHRTPLSGPDAIVFPEIKLELESWTSASDAVPSSALNLTPGTSLDIIARVKLTMHGVTKEGVNIPLRLNYLDQGKGQIQVTGKFDVLLADFGVIVKKFLFIAVKDSATVNLDLLFEPKSVQ